MRDRSGALSIEGSDLRSGDHRDAEDEERGNPATSAPSSDLPRGDAKNQSRLRRGKQLAMLPREIKVTLELGEIVSKGRSPAGIVGNQFGVSSGDGHGEVIACVNGLASSGKPNRAGLAVPSPNLPRTTRKEQEGVGHRSVSPDIRFEIVNRAETTSGPRPRAEIVESLEARAGGIKHGGKY